MKASTLFGRTHLRYGPVNDFLYKAPDGESQNRSNFTRILCASFLSAGRVCSFKKRMIGSIQKSPSSVQNTSVCFESSMLGLGRNSIRRGLGVDLSNMETKPANSSARPFSSRPIYWTLIAWNSLMCSLTRAWYLAILSSLASYTPDTWFITS